MRQRQNSSRPTLDPLPRVSCVATYQLDAPEAADPQGVDDVEVGEVEIREKRVLGFVPALPGANKKGKKTLGEGLEGR